MEIKGTINYTLSKKEDGSWGLSYDQNIENDLAAVATSYHVAESIKQHFKSSKEKSQGKVLGQFAKAENRVAKQCLELKSLFTFLTTEFESWMKYKESLPKSEEAAEKPKEEEKVAE
jgi:hypothetical protein